MLDFPWVVGFCEYRRRLDWEYSLVDFDVQHMVFGKANGGGWREYDQESKT